MTEQPQHDNRVADTTPLGSFHWDQTEDERVVVVEGEVDLSNARQLMRALDGLGRRHLVVDLTRVAFMDSTGLGMLVQLTNDLPGKLELRLREGDQIDRLLAITGLREQFTLDLLPRSD